MSDPANLAPVRHAVEEFCARCGFDAASCDEIGLVVNEAMANVARHAYRGAPDRPVQVSAAFNSGVLRIGIRDWGCGTIPCPPARKQDLLTPGGLGLLCIQKLMDGMTFTPQPDGMLLTMTRSRVRPPATGSR